MTYKVTHFACVTAPTPPLQPHHHPGAKRNPQKLPPLFPTSSAHRKKDLIKNILSLYSLPLLLPGWTITCSTWSTGRRPPSTEPQPLRRWTPCSRMTTSRILLQLLSNLRSKPRLLKIWIPFLLTCILFSLRIKIMILLLTLPPPCPCPSPPLFPLKKPQPLFPNGLPSNCTSLGPNLANSDKATPVTAPKGYFTVTGNSNSMDTSVKGASQNPPTKAKTTYATKAKSPPKPRVMVEHILFVHSTWTNKAPMDSKDWGVVDSHLIEKVLARSPSDPLIRIAHSGYDATHRCGYIACRDLASAEWCQATVRRIGGSQYGVRGAFRAWAKGEQPEARLCRLFFPSRFDNLSEDVLILSLKKHNPTLQQGTLVPKGVDDVQGGRALYVEFDPISYSYIKSKDHKLEFVMMDIDCQVYNPPKRAAQIKPNQTGPGISGISKINKPAQTQSKPIPPTATPSSLPMYNMAAALAARLEPAIPRSANPKTDALAQQPPSSPLKRNRSDAFPPTDGSKRKSLNN